MPDEPNIGDGGSSSAMFPRDVERASEATTEQPPRTVPPAAGEPPAAPAPDQSPRAPEADEPPRVPGPDAPRDPEPPRPPTTGATVAAERAGTPPAPDKRAAATHLATPTAATEVATPDPTTGRTPSTPPGKPRPRARKVRRIVRHVDPWSVLKLSVLFYAALFLIVCVASGLLWAAARGAGTVDDLESFITEVGGFGTCEPIDGAAPTTTTTEPASAPTGPVDQLDPTGPETTLTPDGVVVDDPVDEESCREGTRLVGEFKFEDARIIQAFALGGVVLVLAGAAANVVLVLLFNLMSDLTGGVQVTVLEEDPLPRRTPPTGSPGPRPRG